MLPWTERLGREVYPDVAVGLLHGRMGRDEKDEVMRRFGQYRFMAPVVDNGRLVGALWPQDVIESYNSEILKRDMASAMAMTITAPQTSGQILLSAHIFQRSATMASPMPSLPNSSPASPK